MGWNKVHLELGVESFNSFEFDSNSKSDGFSKQFSYR